MAASVSGYEWPWWDTEFLAKAQTTGVRPAWMPDPDTWQGLTQHMTREDHTWLRQQWALTVDTDAPHAFVRYDLGPELAYDYLGSNYPRAATIAVLVIGLSLLGMTILLALWQPA